MFGELILDPQLPERTSLQQAQGAAKPLHMWPGESVQEMAGHFDVILGTVLDSVGFDVDTIRKTRRATITSPQAVVDVAEED